MRAVSTLIAGVKGAENGFARIFRRGTTTLATVYSDFYGTFLAQGPFGVELDANGGVVVYVDELVDISVTDDTGVTVREFTDGDSSAAVEYVGPAFTGQDYESGASAVNFPITAKEIFDRWVDSAGEPDWNVLFNGVSTTLENALGSVAGLFINVRSPQYGAKGDGVTDDTTAIAQALSDADAQKSIVFFPAGAYRITSTLQVPADVSLWGSGATEISLDAPTGYVLEFGAGSSIVNQEVMGLVLSHFQANTDGIVHIPDTGTRYVTFRRCYIGTSLTTGTTILVGDNGHILTLEDSLVFHNGGLLQGAISLGLQLAVLNVRNSRIILLNPSKPDGSVMVVGRNMYLTNAEVNTTAATNKAIAGVQWQGNGVNGPKGAILGSFFFGNQGGTPSGYGINVVDGNHSDTAVVETGNQFSGNWLAPTGGFVAGTNNPQMTAGSRDAAIQNITSDITPISALNPVSFRTTVLTRTLTGAQQINVSPGPPGARWLLIINNQAGGALGNVSFGGGFIAGTPNIVGLNSTKLAICEFEMVVVGGSGSWVPAAAFQVNF